MKLGSVNIKVNSSVVTFNLLVLLALFMEWVLTKMDVIQQLVDPSAYQIIVVIVSMITLYLRNTNVSGKKPVEIVKEVKNDTK